MDMLSLPRRMVKNATEMGQKFGESGLDNVIDYNAVEQRLLKKQEDSLRWLKKALEPERIEQNSVAAVLDQKMCVGCSACSNVCPSHAIEMGTDLFGYYKARTNYGKCIGCGKCVRVCPAIELPDKKMRHCRIAMNLLQRKRVSGIPVHPEEFSHYWRGKY